MRFSVSDYLRQIPLNNWRPISGSGQRSSANVAVVRPHDRHWSHFPADGQSNHSPFNSSRTPDKIQV